jgi:hypothetical protein
MYSQFYIYSASKFTAYSNVISNCSVGQYAIYYLTDVLSFSDKYSTYKYNEAE